MARRVHTCPGLNGSCLNGKLEKKDVDWKRLTYAQECTRIESGLLAQRWWMTGANCMDGVLAWGWGSSGCARYSTRGAQGEPAGEWGQYSHSCCEFFQLCRWGNRGLKKIGWLLSRRSSAKARAAGWQSRMCLPSHELSSLRPRLWPALSSCWVQSRCCSLQEFKTITAALSQRSSSLGAFRRWCSRAFYMTDAWIFKKKF